MKSKLNQKLIKEIKEMFEIDQDLRLKAKPGKELINYMIYVVDNIHNYRIWKIIKKYDYPTQKLIGKKSMKDFWLLIQHQDYDLDLQEKCFKYCDFELKEKAFLMDRILLHKGKKQKFGTQYMLENNKLVLKPVLDIKNLNKRRIKCGLNTVEEQTNKIRKRHSAMTSLKKKK